MHDTTSDDVFGWMDEPDVELDPSDRLEVERIDRMFRAAAELAAACAPLWAEHREGCRAIIARSFADLDMGWCGHRPSIRPAVRSRVLERDEYRCVECGATDLLQIDHVKPVVKGGTSDESNLQTLCRPCNLRKADR